MRRRAPRPIGVRDEPLALDEVLGRWPSVRQSLLSKFDDCELHALFEMRYAKSWSTHPQAAGTIFHRYAAECLRTMRKADHERIPIGEAMAILEEVLYQRNVPPSERVRVPLRELPLLEMAARKWANDNAFTIRNIVDVERRLEWKLEGIEHWETGEKYDRVLTGQIDLLISRPPDEAVIVDWKKTWQLPPEREEDAEDPGLSYEGFFQQIFYGLGVMRCYPSVNATVMREFYPLRTKARSARITRQDIPKIEQRLRYLVAAYDRALAVGEPKNLHLETLEEHGSWMPSPGKHCFSGDTRFLTAKGVRTLEDASGERVRVLNRDGAWEDAEVKSFGRKRLYRMTFDDGTSLRATDGHRWWVTRKNENGSWAQTDERVTTMEAENVPLVRQAILPSPDPDGIRHGIVYGDGHVYARKNYSMVRLQPHKAELARFFDYQDVPIEHYPGQVFDHPSIREREDGVVDVLLQPKGFKELPEVATPGYARGFVAGLLATDGSVSRNGGVQISCEGRGRAERIAELAWLGGFIVTSVKLSSGRPTNYRDGPRELMIIQLKPAMALILRSDHLARIKDSHQLRAMRRTVVSVEPDGEEETFCVVAPESESFTLASGIVTSNCGNCAGSRLCPIDELFRDDGGIRTPEQAERWAAVRTQAKAIHKFADKHLQIWGNLHGPVPIKHAKGRRVLGYRQLTNGKTRWDEFTPEGVDRPPDQHVHNANLDDAALGRGRQEDPIAYHQAELDRLQMEQSLADEEMRPDFEQMIEFHSNKLTEALSADLARRLEEEGQEDG